MAGSGRRSMQSMIHVPVRMGARWAGRVLRYRETAVETWFFHIWFFPRPLGMLEARRTARST